MDFDGFCHRYGYGYATRGYGFLFSNIITHSHYLNLIFSYFHSFFYSFQWLWSRCHTSNSTTTTSSTTTATTTSNKSKMTTTTSTRPAATSTGDRESIGWRRQWGRARTMPDASFGPYMCFFPLYSCFLNTNLCFIVYTGFNIWNRRHGEWWMDMTTRKGPNDARHVVRALGVFFLFFFFVFIP